MAGNSLLSMCEASSFIIEELTISHKENFQIIKVHTHHWNYFHTFQPQTSTTYVSNLLQLSISVPTPFELHQDHQSAVAPTTFSNSITSLMPSIPSISSLTSTINHCNSWAHKSTSLTLLLTSSHSLPKQYRTLHTCLRTLDKKKKRRAKNTQVDNITNEKRCVYKWKEIRIKSYIVIVDTDKHFLSSSHPARWLTTLVLSIIMLLKMSRPRFMEGKALSPKHITRKWGGNPGTWCQRLWSCLVRYKRIWESG